MARKISDPVVLLRSMGRSKRRRGRSGPLGGLGKLAARWLGGSSVAGMIGAPSRRGRTLPGWAAGALALVCLVGGVLIGRHLVPATPDAGTGLSAAVSGRGPQAPGVLENEGATAPLASEAFLVAFYNFDDAGSEREARARASSLSKYLQEQGFEMARPYRYAATGRFAWCVMVYYDGASQRDATAEALRALPEDVPCEAFRAYKKNLGAGWPQSCPV